MHFKHVPSNEESNRKPQTLRLKGTIPPSPFL